MGRPNASELSEIALIWLAADPRARIMVSSGLVVEWINPAASHLLAMGTGVTVQAGRLHFARPVDEARFRALAAGPGDATATIALPGEDARHHLLLRCRRVSPDADAPICIDIVADHRDGACADQLGAIFGLTASETHVAQAMLEGATVTDVARQRGLSVDTVRTHVRGIYAKTGSASREQFFRRTVPFYFI